MASVRTIADRASSTMYENTILALALRVGASQSRPRIWTRRPHRPARRSGPPDDREASPEWPSDVSPARSGCRGCRRAGAAPRPKLGAARRDRSTVPLAGPLTVTGTLVREQDQHPHTVQCLAAPPCGFDLDRAEARHRPAGPMPTICAGRDHSPCPSDTMPDARVRPAEVRVRAPRRRRGKPARRRPPTGAGCIRGTAIRSDAALARTTCSVLDGHEQLRDA